MSKPKPEETPKLLGWVDPKKVVFEGDLLLQAADPVHPTRAVGFAMAWPAWIDMAMAMLRDALNRAGIDVSALDVPSPTDFLDEVVMLVEKTAVSWQRFFIQAALAWLHAHSPDNAVQAIKGA